jgi:hypothetical protein
MDEDDFPVILGSGSLHDLSDRDEPAPRLAGMRSVSDAAARALHKPSCQSIRRPAGFLRGRRF